MQASSLTKRCEGEGLSLPIYGRVMNYRIGIRTQMSHECLVQFTGVVSAAQAGQLLGKKVLWKGNNKRHVGKIVGFHGKNGVVRVKFKKGLPGQALGTIVELVG
jgi:large subunit ribosomal protein L35Ae